MAFIRWNITIDVVNELFKKYLPEVINIDRVIFNCIQSVWTKVPTCLVEINKTFNLIL